MQDQTGPEIVAPVEDDVLDLGTSARKRSTGLSPAATFGLIIGGGMSAIGLAIYLSGTSIVDPTQLTRPPTLDATPGGQNFAASPELQESLRLENERRANLASELAITSMPTPEIVLQPTPAPVQIPEVTTVERREIQPQTRPEVQVTSRRILPAPPAAPPVQNVQQAQAPVVEVQASPQGRVQTGEQEPENRFASNMIRQMAAISDRQAPRGMTSGEVSRPQSTLRDEPLDRVDPALPGQAGSIAPLFRPGDLLFAEVLTTVSSDLESPVMAEVVSGPHRGARLVGTFAADPRASAMVVSFTSMSLPDGRTVQVNAFAVDGRSAETAVASDVERRYVQRYGPILAATFLSSFAQAQAQPSRIVQGSGQDLQVTLSAPTVRQSLFAGLGAATNVIAQDIARSAPAGPRVNLRAGHPIGILFVEPVAAPQPVVQPG